MERPREAAISETSVPAKMLQSALHANAEILALVSDHKSTPEFHMEKSVTFENIVAIREATKCPRVEALYHANKTLTDHGFTPAWIAFSLDDNPDPTTSQTFGIRNALYLTPNRLDEGWQPPPSITQSTTRAFLTQSATSESPAEPDGGLDHRCFGFCVRVDGRLDDYSALDSLTYIHHDDSSFSCPHGGVSHEHLIDWLERLRDAANGQQVVAFYKDGFGSLAANKTEVECFVSATSIFKSLTQSDRKTVAQFTVALTAGGNPAIAYQLLQIFLCGLPMAWSAITDLHSKNAALSKYRDTLDILRAPLDRISDAVRRTQQDAQTLNAILNDPSRALFASHPLLTEFFDRGGRLSLPSSLPVSILHGVDYKDAVDARLVLAMIIARILGATVELPDGITDKADALAIAKAQLTAFLHRRGDSLPELCASLLFLEGVEDGRDCRQLAESMLSIPADKKVANRTLARIKGALFTPFKMDSKEWHPIALALVIRDCSQEHTKKVELTDFSGGGFRVDIPWAMEPHMTPVTYAAILDFVDKACREAAGRTPPLFLDSCKVWSCGAGDLTIALAFRCGMALAPFRRPDSRSDGLGQIYEHLVEKMKHPGRSPVGDFSKPFADLSRALLGIKASRSSTASGIAWEPDLVAPAEDADVGFALLALQKGNRRFEVRVSEKLILRWFAKASKEDNVRHDLVASDTGSLGKV